MARWAVVVPSVRLEQSIEFINAWDHLFTKHDVSIYMVLDMDTIPTFWIRDRTTSERIHVTCRRDWPEWVPRQSDQCRSYGFWQAWRDGHDYTLSLDDDVRPLIGVDVFQEYEAAFDRGWPCTPYLSVGALTDSGREMRGFPYEGRQARCVVQYGGWDGVLDYDGKTQLDGAPLDSRFAETVIPVPRGVAVTTCAMNMAFRTDFTPCMWQLPVLGERYKRWGDIWSGLIQKRVLDARGEVMLVNGRASVLHDRASDPARNAAIEAPGMDLNEEVWKFALNIWNLDSGSDGRDTTFARVSDHFAFYVEAMGDTEYAKHFSRCRDEWLALFAEKPVAA